MKLFHLCPLLLVFVSPLFLFSQVNTNTKYYSLFQPINATDFVLNQSDEVVAVGGSYWTNNSWFLHLDSTGSIVSSKSYGTGSLNKLFRMTDSTFVAVGDSYAGPTTTGNHAIVIGLTESGDTLWTRELYSSTATSSSAWDVQLTSDSNIVVAGECNNGLNAFVAKLDASGNITWSRVFSSQEPQTSSFKFFAVEMDSSGNLVLAGQRISDSQVYGVLMKMQDDGTVLWSKSGGAGTSFQTLLNLGSAYYSVNAYSSILFKTDDLGTVLWSELTIPAYNEYSGIEFSLEKETDSTFLFTGHNLWNGGVVRINSIGEVLEYGNLLGKGFKTRKRSDGKFTMLLNGPVYGLKSSLVITPHFGVSQFDSLSQQQVCSFSQSTSPVNIPLALINTNVTQTGQLTVSQPGLQVLDLELLSEDGCIDILGALNELDERNVKLYPNPANSSLHVFVEGNNSVVYQVFNTLGREVFSGTAVSNEFELDVHSLSNGTYYLRTGNITKMFNVLR